MSNFNIENNYEDYTTVSSRKKNVPTTTVSPSQSLFRSCFGSTLKSGAVFFPCKNTDCPFAHSLEEMKIDKCKFNPCKNANNCNFLHGSETISQYCLRKGILLPEKTVTEKSFPSKQYCLLFKIPFPQKQNYEEKVSNREVYERHQSSEYSLVNDFPALGNAKPVQLTVYAPSVVKKVDTVVACKPTIVKKVDTVANEPIEIEIEIVCRPDEIASKLEGVKKIAQDLGVSVRVTITEIL